jgi:transcriptional regulator with XRE-family HTH domain
LWREVLGQRLRALRAGQGETLSQTAGRAGLSPQYLSEVERGRKEPSSEMIAALAGALGITLIELTEQVAGELRRQQGVAAPRASGPVMLARAA